MALPVTINTIALTGELLHQGPFLSSGGNVYVVGRDATTVNKLQILKATDPTSSFSSIASTTYSGGTSIACIDVWQDGDDLHIVGHFQNVCAYFRFSMSSDSFTQTVTAVEAQLSSQSGAWGCTLARRSDGDLVCIYSGDQVSIMGTSYDRIYYNISTDNGATWGTPVEFDAGGKSVTANYRRPSCLVGTSDTIHCAYALTTALYQRALSSSDVLQTERDTTFTVKQPQAGICSIGKGRSFVRSSTTKLRIPFIDNSGAYMKVLSFDAASDPSSFTAPTLDGLNAAATNGNPQVAVDGSVVHCLWVRSSDVDIYSSNDQDTDSWTTPANKLTGSISYLNARIFTRSGNKVIAYVYADSPDRKYNEISLGGNTSGKAESAGSTPTCSATGAYGPSSSPGQGQSQGTTPVCNAAGNAINPALAEAAGSTPTAQATGAAVLAGQGQAAGTTPVCGAAGAYGPSASPGQGQSQGSTPVCDAAGAYGPSSSPAQGQAEGSTPTANAVSNAIFAGQAQASGSTPTCDAVGQAVQIISGQAQSAGTSEALATGASIFAGLAESVGNSTSQATSAASAHSLAEAAGTSEALGTIIAFFPSMAEAAGTSTAEATGAGIQVASGQAEASGTSDAQAAATWKYGGEGESAGTSTAQATGASSYATLAEASGSTPTANATGAYGPSASPSQAEAVGSSTALATGSATFAAQAESVAGSTSQSTGASTNAAVASAEGSSVVDGVAPFVGNVAEAAGSSTAEAAGASIAAVNAEAAGLSSVAGAGGAIVPATGESTALGTALASGNAITSAIAESDGLAIALAEASWGASSRADSVGAAIAEAIGAATYSALAEAAGSSSADAVGEEAIYVTLTGDAFAAGIAEALAVGYGVQFADISLKDFDTSAITLELQDNEISLRLSLPVDIKLTTFGEE